MVRQRSLPPIPTPPASTTKPRPPCSNRASPNPEPDEQWPDLAPLLDELITHLSHRDRQAVLPPLLSRPHLRRPSPAKPKPLKKPPANASTAPLEKLRRFASHKTETALSAASLCAILTPHSATSAPAGLIASTTTIATTANDPFAALTSTATPILKGTLAMMTFAKLKSRRLHRLHQPLAIAGGTVAIVHAANPPARPRPRGANIDYPKLAPFTDTRFRHPEIKVNGAWYELAAPSTAFPATRSPPSAAKPTAVSGKKTLLRRPRPGPHRNGPSPRRHRQNSTSSNSDTGEGITLKDRPHDQRKTATLFMQPPARRPAKTRKRARATRDVGCDSAHRLFE